MSAQYHLTRFASSIVKINAYFIHSVKFLLDEEKEKHYKVYLFSIELQLPLMDLKNTIIKRKLA